MTGAFSQNVGKLFSELKLVTDNLSLYLCSSQLRSHWKQEYCGIVQGRSHQIWSDQVGSAHARTLYPIGAWEHAPPGKFWFLGAMRLLLRHCNFGPIRCFSEVKRQSFTWMPICPLRHTPMVSAFQSSLLIGRKPHPLRVKLARLIVRL